MADSSLPVAVVTILYRNKLDWFEKVSLMQITRHLGNYPVVAVLPRGSRPSGLNLLPRHTQICELDLKWFMNQSTYNRLLLNPLFYSMFIKYRKILICQIDAFVFSDRLNDFVDMKYDYIGAPWISGELIQRYNFPFSVQLSKLMYKINPQFSCFVGNGGFSLRNPKACFRLLTQTSYWERRLSLNEDGFFAFHGGIHSNLFSIAPVKVAVDFAWENDFTACYELNQKRLPFGVHAWQKCSDPLKRQLLGEFLQDYLLDIPEVSDYIGT